jgi:hypothetical protein
MSDRHRPASNRNASLATGKKIFGPMLATIERGNVKRNEKCTEYLRYQFTAEETTENAKDLARRTMALAELELKKKQLAADIKAETDKVTAEVARLSRFVNDEYDFRMISCLIEYNSPKVGKKTIVREDTGEIVRNEDMAGAEMQDELPLT